MANGETRYAKQLERLEALIKSKLTAKAKLLHQELVEDYDDFNFYVEYRRSVRALINQINVMKTLPNADVVELAVVISMTAQLLDETISIEDYAELMNEVQGRPYPHANALAGLMFAVGFCGFLITLLGLLFTTGAVAPLVVGMVFSFILYFGSIPMMNSGIPGGLSREISTVSDASKRCAEANQRHFDFFQSEAIDNDDDDFDYDVRSVVSVL